MSLKPDTSFFRQLPTHLYGTRLGRAVVGDARDVLGMIPDDSVDLVMTSPPFALLREKAYGNKDQAEYVDWLCGFGVEVRRVLKNTGSFVLDLWTSAGLISAAFRCGRSTTTASFSVSATRSGSSSPRNSSGTTPRNCRRPSSG